MSDWRNKRYQFRLTKQDEKIYNFISSSNKTESETIRTLLKFAVSEIDKVKEDRKQSAMLKNIMEEIDVLKTQQKKVIEQLEKGITTTNNIGEDESQINVSVDNSIDSMMSSFGID